VLSDICPRFAYIKVAVETLPADIRKLAEAAKAAGGEQIIVIVDKKNSTTAVGGIIGEDDAACAFLIVSFETMILN